MRILICILCVFFLKSGLVLAEDVASAEELYSRGVDFMKHEDTDQAIEMFEQASRAQPDSAYIWNGLGIAYMNKNGYEDDAINAFQRSLELLPSQPDAYANLGILYCSGERDLKMAEEYLEKAIALQPDNLRANFGLGWVFLLEKHDGKQAAKLFDLVLKKEPKNATALYGLGLANLGMENRAMALKSISMLRFLNREDLASNLEFMMHPERNMDQPSEIKENTDVSSAPDFQGLT